MTTFNKQGLEARKLLAQKTGDQHMKNIDMNVTGTILTIKVDLSKSYGPSKSGKTTIIATSEGNVDVPEAPGVKVGLNIYKGR